MKRIENMSDFFTKRADGYDEHMLNCVEGCKEGYIKMAELIPSCTKNLLDLGCGTGLELDEIFKKFPDICVTGIDLTQAMLDKLKEKHPNKKITAVCADYFEYDLGMGVFDCAVSFQTMHHFSHEKKIGLYKKVFESLTESGVYIECDYMVVTQEEEDFLFAENDRIRKEQGIQSGEFYHFDTPCTIDNQIKMLSDAGFKNIRKIFRKGNTTILVADKNI